MDIFGNIRGQLNSPVLRTPWFACPLCHTLGRGRALCAHCAEHLYAKREPVVRRHSHISIHSLFSWRKDDWLGLRWWALALKRKEHFAYWREPALWMLETFHATGPGTVLVPVPSSSGESHARGFARAISHYTGWPVEERLKLVTSNSAQKRLGRKERQYRAFEATPAPPNWSKYTNVLIVDDIVTTGATVKAAFQALKTPVEVWCLLDRRPCETNAPLL